MTTNDKDNASEITPEEVKQWLEDYEKSFSFNEFDAKAAQIFDNADYIARAYLEKCEEVEDLERVLHKKDSLVSKEKLYLIIQKQKTIIDKQREIFIALKMINWDHRYSDSARCNKIIDEAIAIIEATD